MWLMDSWKMTEFRVWPQFLEHRSECIMQLLRNYKSESLFQWRIRTAWSTSFISGSEKRIEWLEVKLSSDPEVDHLRWKIYLEKVLLKKTRLYTVSRSRISVIYGRWVIENIGDWGKWMMGFISVQVPRSHRKMLCRTGKPDHANHDIFGR